MKDIREMLGRRGLEFTRLTPVVKRKWTMLLCHNEHDCIGMQWVCVRAAEMLRDGESWDRRYDNHDGREAVE